jgi:hypothetical protein
VRSVEKAIGVELRGFDVMDQLCKCTRDQLHEKCSMRNQDGKWKMRRSLRSIIGLLEPLQKFVVDLVRFTLLSSHHIMA